MCRNFKMKNILTFVLTLIVVCNLTQIALAAPISSNKITDHSLKRSRVAEKKISKKELKPVNNIVVSPQMPAVNTQSKISRQVNRVNITQKTGGNFTGSFKKIGAGLRNFAAGVTTKIGNFFKPNKGLKSVSSGIDQRAFEDKDRINVFDSLQKTR